MRDKSLICQNSETRRIGDLDWTGLSETCISSQTPDLLFPRLHSLTENEKISWELEWERFLIPRTWGKKIARLLIHESLRCTMTAYYISPLYSYTPTNNELKGPSLGKSTTWGVMAADRTVWDRPEVTDKIAGLLFNYSMRFSIIHIPFMHAGLKISFSTLIVNMNGKTRITT